MSGDAGSMLVIDTEGLAAEDDLDTINGAAVGDIIILFPNNESRIITLKHNTGNIWLPGEQDMRLLYRAGVILRKASTYFLVIGGGTSVYHLVQAANFAIAGGYMSTADKQSYITYLSAKSNAFTSNFSQMIDGNTGTSVSSGVACNAYPYWAMDFGEPVALDQIQVLQHSSDYLSTWWVYGSNTGDFSGEEETIVNGVSGGGTTANLTFATPKVYRYWKVRGYKSDAATFLAYEINFRYQSTFMLAGIPFGCKVELYDGVTLKESQTYDNTVYVPALLQFVTPTADFDTVKISFPDDQSTVWLEFSVSASDGDVYTLYAR